jgi:lipoprotein-releasing system permease protein
MTFEWLVALRYLRSPNRPAVLRIVTLLAVVGVAAGVTTLVIALSMNTGFRQAIRDRLLSVTAHVNLKPVGTEGIRDYRQLIGRLEGTPGVRSIEPAIYNTVLLLPPMAKESPGYLWVASWRKTRKFPQGITSH